MQKGTVMTRKMFQMLTVIMRVNRVIREQNRQKVIHDPRWAADTCRDCDEAVDRATHYFNGAAW